MKYYYYFLLSTLCVVFSSICQAKTVHASLIRIVDNTSYHHCQYISPYMVADLVNQGGKENRESQVFHSIYADVVDAPKVARVICTSGKADPISFLMYRSLNDSTAWQRFTSYPGFDFDIKINNDASHPMHVCLLGSVEDGHATIDLRDATPCVDGDIEIQ